MVTPLQRLAANARLRLGAAVLAGLLQRLPALRAVAAAAEALLETPAAAAVRTAGLALAALGAVDAVAGATTYTLSTGSPGHPTPYTVTEGSQIEAVAFSLESDPPTQAPPGSWSISGSIPPGLQFGLAGNFLTGPGEVDTANPLLEGTPTTPGSYTMTLQAWEDPGASGLSSTVFTYVVVVNSTNLTPTPPPAPSPTPTPTPTPSPTPTPNPDAPTSSVQPSSQTVASGHTVTFSFPAVGDPSPTFQWYLNGAPVAGGTHSTLVVSGATAADAGTYTCKATNASGLLTSRGASLTVATTSDPGRLVNVSSRAQAGTGASIIFGGFAIGPTNLSGQETVLIRASGPALTSFGVPGVLPDPQIQLFNSSSVAIEGDLNTSWGGAPEIASAAALVGAFAWSDATSHDAALLLPLVPGAYTAQVSGESGDTGVALMEVYDTTPAASYLPSDPRLVNLSARVDVQTGAANALFVGFVIHGSTSITVLIRVSGPALAKFGVSGTLPDPRLSLQTPPPNGTILGTNAGWGGDAEIAAAAAAVGAFAWTDGTSADSALLVTLAPGAYDVVVDGVSGDAGAVLVELYEIP